MAVDARHPKPTLVLLPGLDGTGSLFCEFRQALDASITTMVISYPCDGGVDYVELEGVARASLPRRQPFVLLGESFSGPIAISIAASRPAGLCGLILSCSFARNPLPILSPLRPLVRFLPIRAAPVAVLARPVLGRFATPRLQSALASVLSRVPSWVIRRRLRAVLGVDVTAFLPQVQVPVLYLRASEDRLVPRSASAALSALPRIRFAEVDGPHFLLQARPSAAAKHVRSFLREIKVL